MVPERVGFILHTGEVVEVSNISKTPAEEFEVSPAVMIEHEDTAMATWHTHPVTTAELSSDDYKAFLMWPDYIHFIVSPEGINGYIVKNRAVVRDASKDHPAWAFTEGLAARL